MLFTEKDLLNAFKANVDNKGWIYFVGNPESNAKFIIDYMKKYKEPINEEELNELAINEGAKAIQHFINKEQSKFAFEWADLVKEAYKAGFHKALLKQYGNIRNECSS